MSVISRNNRKCPKNGTFGSPAFNIFLLGKPPEPPEYFEYGKETSNLFLKKQFHVVIQSDVTICSLYKLLSYDGKGQ